MAAKANHYDELSRSKISKNRNAVISRNGRGGITLAQQLEVREGEQTTTVFMKGAIHLDGLEELISFRDAVDVAVKLVKEQEDAEAWDES